MHCSFAQTTAVAHHTYRLVRRAEAVGMVVIDDPLSILRCTNKVYLAELLSRQDSGTSNHRGASKEPNAGCRNHHLPVRAEATRQRLFTRGGQSESCGRIAAVLDKFLDSELVIVQQYMQTDFDWRIGLLDGRPLWACKYHMARGNWQIAKHADDSKATFGKCETLPIKLAPRKCVALAEKAASLIGNGLYGVDLKESEGQFFVIEINDNPNLDSGVEDRVLREELYRRIMESFVKRIEKMKAK